MILILDLVISEPFIVTVAQGFEQGLSWLVDPFLGDVAVTKFSGSQCAGSNMDRVGMTCDAFAHFSLHDSDGSFVLVDIQGIIASKRLIGAPISGEEKVTLFDFMAHSINGEMCLGDRGKPGIRQFRQQHVCNSICEGLGLEKFDTFDDDDDSSSDQEKHDGEKRKGSNAPGSGLGPESLSFGLEYESETPKAGLDDQEIALMSSKGDNDSVGKQQHLMMPPPPPPPENCPSSSAAK
ncbi:hypothetical protein CVT24_012095 [Panaeolus cyanescens]|uniref:Alpha-type protein kinase domain-containing protein n=1 Tax=Panaeolus cyanescens TaxID=181874 RepID=A0A409XA00_9AGAR|nr:hypothetical protein CVT24_012095 [Panaeolus cyanescens]